MKRQGKWHCPNCARTSLRNWNIKKHIKIRHCWFLHRIYSKNPKHQGSVETQQSPNKPFAEAFKDHYQLEYGGLNLCNQAIMNTFQIKTGPKIESNLIWIIICH